MQAQRITVVRPDDARAEEYRKVQGGLHAQHQATQRKYDQIAGGLLADREDRVQDGQKWRKSEEVLLRRYADSQVDHRRSHLQKLGHRCQTIEATSADPAIRQLEAIGEVAKRGRNVPDLPDFSALRTGAEQQQPNRVQQGQPGLLLIQR